MNKKIFYLILLPIYEIFGTFISYKFMPGEKAGLIIALIGFFILWLGTIWLMEKDNFLMKTTKKAKAMFNYFDMERVKELLNSKKTKGDRFEMFCSDDRNQKVTVLTIKILNNDNIKRLPDGRRLKTLGKLLEIIELNVEKRFGIVYNMFDDKITCLFNTVYMIDNPDLEAVKTALNINIDLMSYRNQDNDEKDKDINIDDIKLDMSIVNEDMDFFIRDKRVIVNGDFKLSNELVDISGEETIYVPEKIFNKYSNKFDYDYLGKFYFECGDTKVYKIYKIVNDEEIKENTYKASKLKLKKGSEKKLKKYVSELEEQRVNQREEERLKHIL